MMEPEAGENRRLSAEDTLGAHSRLVLCQLPAVFWTVDRDLRFTSSFGRGLQKLGLRDAQVVGMSLYEFFGTTDAGHPAIKGHLEAFTGAHIRYELQWQSRWYESVLSPIRDADGAVIAVAGMAMDISERKKAELRWRAVHEISQAAFETESLESFYPIPYRIIGGLMRAENFYIALLDQAGKFLYFPFYRDERDTEWGPIPSSEGLTGYVARTGRSMIVCASDLERLRETEKVRCVGPEPACWLGVPLKLPGRTIGVICVQTYDTRECYSEEDLLLLEFVARHIAGAIERRRVEDALARSEQRYRSFIAHSTEGIWCFEADPPIDTRLPEDIQIKEILSRARLTECNDEFARMYGYESAREMTGVKLSGLLPESDPRTTEYLRNFIRSGYRLMAVESYERDRLGNPKVFLNNFSGVITEGKLVRAWGTQVDLTEKKKLEEEMIRLQRWDSLSLLAAGIAHDFNNILVGITGNLSLALAEAEKNTIVANLLEDALQASDRARSLAIQLITFTRGGTPTKKAVDLNQLIPATVRLALVGTRVKATLSLPADLWQVEGDPSQLEQVFQNLTLNAVEAMPDGGSVKVTAMNRYLEESGGHPGLPLERGPYVEIHFEDTGIGIPREDLPHIFEPFYTRKAGGTGLGLAVVYSIVRRHQGHITAQSFSGGGTVFRLLLPACPERVEERPAPLFREPKPVSGGRALIMDDETVVRKVLSRMLEKLGYTVTETADGTEAVRIFREETERGTPFDLVIVDLTVAGGMGGREALPHLRELKPNVRVIATTGYSDERVLALPREFGFDGVLRKPFRLQDLAETLKSCEKVPMGTNGTGGEKGQSAGKGDRNTTNRKEEKDNSRAEAGFRESD